VVDRVPKTGAGANCANMDSDPRACSNTNNTCFWDVTVPSCCERAKVVDKTVSCKTPQQCSQQSVGAKGSCLPKDTLISRARAMCEKDKKTLDMTTLNFDSTCKQGTFAILRFECCSPPTRKPCTADSTCAKGEVCVNKFCEPSRVACGSVRDCPFHSPYCVAGFCSQNPPATKCQPFSGWGCKTLSQWQAYATGQCREMKMTLSSVLPHEPCRATGQFSAARWTCCPTTSTQPG
jgi:hypothetical protein